MPVATEYTPDDKEVRESAQQELLSRRLAIARAWNYYDGNPDLQLRPTNGVDHNVEIPLFERAVNSTISFLLPDMPFIELIEPQETDSERWLRKAWERGGKGGAVFLHKVAQNGCMSGQCFVRISPPESDKYPRLFNIDPANVLGFWKDSDRKEVLWYEIYKEAGKTRLRKDVIDLGDRWLIRQYEQQRTSDTAQVSAEATPWQFLSETAWPYPLGPIVDWQHLASAKRYYGHSEAGNLRLNDLINRTASDAGKILHYHASPRTIGTGFRADEVTPTAIENFYIVENPDAKVFNLKMKGDLSASMDNVQYLTEAYMHERRVADPRAGKVDTQHLTSLGGGSPVLFYMDQRVKTEELRRNYGGGIVAICHRMLMLGGRAFDVPVNLYWTDPPLVDHAQAVDVLAIEHRLGLVSRETAAKQRGYDWKQERERMAREAERAQKRMARKLNSGER